MEGILIAIGIIILLALIYFGVGIYISCRINFVTRRTPAQLYRNEWKENYPHNMINVPHKKMYIKSKLGYDLAAKYFPVKNKKSHKYMLLLHGYNNSSRTCGKYALLFNARGYNCLAPDARRCGESKGRGITFGYYERSDAEQWIEEIYKMDPEAEIGLFGISLGAATSILIASLRSDIKFVVSYCSFSSFKDIILDKGKALYSDFIKIMYPSIVFASFLLTGARADLVDVAAAIKNVECPVLIMHSKADAFTPVSHANRLYQAKPDAYFHTFEKSPHAKAYSTETKAFKDFIYNFLDEISS